MHSTGRKWVRCFKSLFGKLCHTLFFKRKPNFTTLHTTVYQLVYELATANDPKTICSEFFLSLASALMEYLGMVMLQDEQSNMTILCIDGCLNSSLRDECLSLNATQSIPSP